MKSKDVDKASGTNRREFLKAGGAITAGLVAQAALPASAATLPSLPSNPATPNAMPTRNLGKTGYRVGIFSLGGQAAIERADNEAVAVPIIEKALDLGVNYIDTSSIYGGPQRWSEQYVGQGDEEAAFRGIPRQQDEGAHQRRLTSDVGEVPQAAQHRSSRSVAIARHRLRQ